MKFGVSLVIAFLLGALVVYLITLPQGAWALVTSGVNKPGVFIRGLFESKAECAILRDLFLKNADKSAEVFKERGVMMMGGGWATVSCLPLNAVTGLPGPEPDFSGIESALSEIATNVTH